MLKVPKNALILAILFTLACGLFLRFYHISLTPYWMDEGYTVNAVQATIDNGTRAGSAILDSGEPYFCPLYCTPTSWVVRAVGPDPASYRVLSVFFGLLIIPLVYLLTQLFFQNKSAALLSAFITSFSYWQIAWSRQARWYTMLEFFFWTALGLFYLFLKTKDTRKKIIFFSLSLIFTILSITTHKLAYLLPPIMLLWFLYENRPKKDEILLASMATLIVIIFAEFGLGLHFITNAIQKVDLHYSLPYYLSFYLRNYWLFLLLAVYGYFQATPAQKKSIVLLASPFFIYLFFLSFFTNIVHYRYLFHTTVVLYIVASVVVVQIVQGVKKQWLQALFATSFLAIFFLTGHGQLLAKGFYALESDNPSALSRPYYAYTPQPDFNIAYGKVKELMKPEDIIISSHPHFNKIFLNQPGYWIRYDYLGMEDTVETIKNNKEYYVNAEVINNLAELQELVKSHHGYIVFDFMASDGRIDGEIITHIRNNLELVYAGESANVFSQIWVYKF